MAEPSYDVGMPRIVSDEERETVHSILKEFAQLKTWRYTTATQWEEIAELIDPPSRNTFQFGDYNWPGTKKTDRQVDASGMMALERFGAICDSLLTPRNSTWHGLSAGGANAAYIMKDRPTLLWFQEVSATLFRERYKPEANFSSQNQMTWRSLGAYGTAGIFVDEFDYSNGTGGPGLRYKGMPVGQLFIRENHQGLIDGFCRWFKMTARQAYQRWGKMGTFPEALRPALEQNSELLFHFLHCVRPRTDYDPKRIDKKGKPWASFYVSFTGEALLSEGGYRRFPLAASRYTQTPDEVYGRGPASYVLPALKTLNAEKRTFLKAGHRAADPTYLTADDGIADFSMRPGALNKGGVTADGKPLVIALEPGNIQISKEMMDEEKSLINDSFLVSLFQILTETPQMTATEVIERTNEKGILMAPTLGRQQSEYLGPMIERELDVLNYLGMLPPMPPRLREARGEYSVVYTSPLSKAAKAGEAAGFMRTMSLLKEVIDTTQDPSPLDNFDMDQATTDIARLQSVPENWIATPQDVANKRRSRAQSQAIQQKIQALPAQAAMMKAQAVAAKEQPNGQSQAPLSPGGAPPQQQQPDQGMAQ